MRNTICLFLLVVLAFPTSGLPFSPPEDTTRINVKDLVSEALSRNPAILAAERRWLAAQQKRAQVTALPDPNVSFSRFGENVETRVGPQESVISLSQRIPFPGKLGLQGKMAGQDALAEGFHYEATKRDVLFEVRQTYYDLYWVDQSLNVLKEYLALLQDFTRVAEQRYATGQGIQTDVLKSQVEISATMERRFGFEKMRQSVAARLNALLDRPQDAGFGVASTIDTAHLVMSEAALVDLAMAGREELQTVQAMVGKSEFMKSLARRNYWPDFTLSANYIDVSTGRSTAPDAGKNAWSVMVGLNMPIWLGKRKAAVREADELLASNRLAYENLENQVKSEIRDHYYQIEITGKTLELYEQGLIPQAESSLESAIANYSTGRLGFLDLLDAERMLLSLRLGHIKEQANYQKQIAAIERTVGGELQ